ncbi:MAG: Calx-beta domain-containing protein [Pirellulales bacterium]
MLEVLEPRLAMALAVPALSSLPGANHTIFLDFDGHVTSGTAWNSSYGVTSIDSPAYSSDADTANFSTGELSVIQNAWKRVAEDFAPFQVNVTTVPPVASDLVYSGSGDTRWGVRVVVTRDVAFNCGCGGIAYIDSFNWNSDTPVYVFNTSEIGVAEAISHEVGHSLGLAHDGTASASYYSGHGSGATSWAPIMGVGYYVNVSQWDKGEYTGSNNGGSGANYGKGPDDLAIITSYNGFGYRADDHGNADATATALTISGSSAAGAGIIERTADVDVFRFTTGAGTVSFNINPAALGANLDLKVDLVDSSGTVLTSVNPSAALNATLSQSLAAGTYFLRLDGVGVGTPTASTPTGYTDYGSIGQYTITGTLVPTGSDVLDIAATDASKAEGNSGSTTYTFTVTRGGDTSGTTTVNYTVAGSGTSPASAADFAGGVLPTGTLTFLPGDTSQQVSIQVAGDTTVESNETFQISLSQASGTTSIGQGFASGTILNDDVAPTPPTLSLSATSANRTEGTGTAATPFTFTVTRSGSTSGTASVNYSVAGAGNRPANSADFSGGFPSGTVNFSVGQTSATITVNVVADSTKESNETFRVTLSNAVGASLGTATANGTIVNDDSGRNGRAASEGGGSGRSSSDDEEFAGRELIAVADPLWYFVPTSDPSYVPGLADAVETHWAVETPWLDQEDLDHEDDHDHGHGLERDFATVFAMLHGGLLDSQSFDALQDAAASPDDSWTVTTSDPSLFARSLTAGPRATRLRSANTPSASAASAWQNVVIDELAATRRRDLSELSLASRQDDASAEDLEQLLDELAARRT